MDQETKWTVAICTVLAIATAAIAFVSITQSPAGRELKKAPQLKLDNPGTQSDFPTAATESEVG